MLQREKVRAEQWIADLPQGCWCAYTDGGYTPAREAIEKRPATPEKCGYGGTLQYRVVQAHGIDERRVRITGKRYKAEIDNGLSDGLRWSQQWSQ